MCPISTRRGGGGGGGGGRCRLRQRPLLPACAAACDALGGRGVRAPPCAPPPRERHERYREHAARRDCTRRERRRTRERPQPQHARPDGDHQPARARVAGRDLCLPPPLLLLLLTLPAIVLALRPAPHPAAAHRASAARARRAAIPPKGQARLRTGPQHARGPPRSAHRVRDVDDPRSTLPAAAGRDARVRRGRLQDLSAVTACPISTG